jgi:hypothetical protein
LPAVTHWPLSAAGARRSARVAHGLGRRASPGAGAAAVFIDAAADRESQHGDRAEASSGHVSG